LLAKVRSARLERSRCQASKAIIKPIRGCYLSRNRKIQWSMDMDLSLWENKMSRRDSHQPFKMLEKLVIPETYQILKEWICRLWLRILKILRVKSNPKVLCVTQLSISQASSRVKEMTWSKPRGSKREPSLEKMATTWTPPRTTSIRGTNHFRMTRLALWWIGKNHMMLVATKPWREQKTDLSSTHTLTFPELMSSNL
jgi:hypothetical protein